MRQLGGKVQLWSITEAEKQQCQIHPWWDRKGLHKKCRGIMAWGDAHLLNGLLCKDRALCVDSRIYIPPQCWGARDSRVPGACHPQSLVNQWASLVTNPGAKVKVDRGGGRYSVEIFSLHEHGHVRMPHIEVDTYKLSKMYRDVWQFSKYKKYYTEQEISYLSQITFFHFLLNLLQRNLLGFPSVLVR